MLGISSTMNIFGPMENTFKTLFKHLHVYVAKMDKLNFVINVLTILSYYVFCCKHSEVKMTVMEM